MNKKIILYAGVALGAIAVIAIALYLYAFTTLKHQMTQQSQVKGFRLYLDGIVIDKLAIDPSIKMTKVYLHGMPWELLRDAPEYISIAQIDINADNLLSRPIPWPFEAQSIDVPLINIHKTILNQVINFTGSAKQSPETPILLDFSNNDEKQSLSGKIEIRTENHKIQMIDVDLDEANLDFSLFGTKRASGWLSFSYEEDWQIVGELDAGITLMGPYQFFDSTAKLTGAVAQPEMTFSGQLDQQLIVIDQREGKYFLGRDDQTLPIAETDNPISEIVHTLDRVKQFKTAEENIAKLRQQKQAEEEQEKLDKKQKADAEKAKEAEKKKEAAAIQPAPIKIEPVVLPQIILDSVTGNTSLAGFIYKEPLVPVKQPCAPNVVGQCWTAHGQGGKFTYNPDALPSYFLQLKDYEQLKQLRAALLDFNVQVITVQGKDKTAQNIVLKGTTANNQPAEIQLAVVGLE